MAAAVAAGCAWGAVSEYVRTMVTNFNGHVGCDLVTYVKPATAQRTGRAWIMKFDMSKGYRLRAYYGDGNGGRARIGTMGENLVAEGERPICGTNADYFYTASNMAYSTGMTIMNSRMVYPGFNNANPATHYFFMETGDRRYAHGKPVRTDGKTSGFVAHGYDLVTADGRKIRNAVRTNWCNYPVKEGQINPVNENYATVGKVEGTIGNYQSRTQYPRVMIGYGTNEVDGAQHEIVAMFVNDGRQADWSYGVTDVDAAQMMIDEGCWEVGEFDGGGSAALWAASGPDCVYPRDTTANGGYLNLPSDGYPRMDANGIFMLAPTDAPATVTIGANWYYDLDEALWAVAPGETITVTNATTLTGTNVFFTSCMITCDAGGTSATPTIACPAGTALAVPAGVRVCFSNVVFTGASTTLRAAGTAAVAGSVSFDRVDVVSGGAFELAGPLDRALVVNNPAAAAEGDIFGTATGNFGAGVRLLRHPSDATLVARAISNGSTATLRWTRATDVSGGLSSANYVRDGLVAQFDALENTGVGQYSASATEWKDLVGNGKVALAGTAAWGDRYLDATTTKQSITSLARVYNWSVTAEFAVNVISNAAPAGAEAGKSYWPTFFGEGSYRVHSTGVKKGAAPASGYRLFVNSRDPRPTMSSFWSGTMGTTSDGTNYRMYRDGTFSVGVVDTGALNMNKLGATWTLNENGTSGFFHNHCYAFRLYDSVLTEDELEQNGALDGLRFFSFTYTGMGYSVDWSAIPWTAPERATTTAPNAETHYAQVKNATVAVHAADAVSLKGISLENGATLDIASDAVVDTHVLYVGGTRVPRGIYTGTGTFGTQVDWLSGGGVLRVAGSFAASVPTTIAVPASDGWYEFGLTAAEGGGYGYTKGYPASPNSTLHWIKADHPQWQDYAFEPGAKLRLVGYVFLEQIPAGVFDEIDLSHATYILVHAPQPYADGSAFTLPTDVEARYQPGTGWVEVGGTNWLVTAGSSAFTSDLEVAGTWRIYGDGTQYANQQYDGAFGGTGTLKFENFSKQARFTSSFALNGSVTGFENAQLLWIDALAVTSRLNAVAFSNCGNTYQTNASFSATGIFFGKNNSGATADHELYVASVSGGARSIVDAKGRRWRCGGVIAAWGSNTVHVGKLTNPLHIVARRQDQDCNRGWFSSASAVGPGFFVFDEIAAGLFLSTNVYVTAGKVTGSPVFDWTYQSGAVNRMTFDITNTCSSTAVAKATDIAMLPARLSGFAGSVQLTDPATRTYAVEMDFTRGTNALYNVGGCIGSGTLTEAPTAGEIAVTFQTGEDVELGDYALARFTGGGGLLANWTVTLNGSSAPSADLGKGYSAAVVKDATGLWLKVRKGGLWFVIR